MASDLSQYFNMIPLSRNRQLDVANILFNLENWSRYHFQRAIENWYFYKGYHNLFFRRFPAEDDVTFFDRVKNSTIENHIQQIVDLIVSYLYPHADPVKRYVNRDDQPDDDINKFFRETVWNPSKIQEVDDSKALNALVTGYTIVQRKIIDLDTGLPFPLGSTKTDIIKRGYIQKIPLDSTLAIPLPYIDDNGIINYRKLGAIFYLSDNDNFVGHNDLQTLLNRPLQRKRVMEFVDDRVWLRFTKDLSRTSSSGWVQETVNPGSAFENKNPFGSIDTAFTVYRNLGDPFDVEGDSEVLKMRSINMEINELGNGDKDTILYHSYPILFAYGFKMPDDFKRTKNAVVELPDADSNKQKAEYLTWDGSLDASANRQDSLRRSLTNVSGMSLLSRGFLKEIGQIRSGPPLKALFSGDRAKMGRIFTVFQVAEIEDMRNDLKFWEFYTGQSFKVDKSVSFHCEFTKDFLGIDALLDAEIQAVKLGAGAESIEEVLTVEHPEWSDTQIQDAIKQIEKAKQAQQKPVNQVVKSSDKSGIAQNN